MSARRVAILASVLAAAIAAAVLPAVAAKSYRAEHHHVRVVVEPGGSLVVTESVRFALGPDSFTYMTRELPTRKTDGLTILEVSMDGVPMARGKAAGQYELKRDDDRRRIVWHFASTSNAARTFTVTYRAAGVVWQDAQSDVLEWTLVPTRHEYVIACASGEVDYPAGASLVADAVLVPPAADVQYSGQTVRFERCPIERNASWVVAMRFARGSVAPVAPRWQQRARLSRENTPLFLGLAGLMLFAGLGGFILFALNHRQPPHDSTGTVASPPDSLSPALAGTILSTGASMGWGAALAAIMELARRGALMMQSVEKTGAFRSQEVRITRGPTPVNAMPHEKALLELLFTDKHGPRTSVTFSELARTFASSRNWKRLRDAVASDLRAARLLDGDRERTRGRVMMVGLLLILLSVAGFIAAAALISRLGEPVLAVPIALLAVGVTGMIAGASLSPLSEEGHRRAERWRAFKRAMGNASEPADGGASVAADRVEQWLPYAVAFGTALAWMKRLQKQGVAMGPSWLSAISREGTHSPATIGATVAVLSAGSSAGAHAGGHAGGASGAAGGGSSSVG